MVGTGVALADAVLHQTGQARQHRDRRVDAVLVQRPVEDDLSLGDVAGQVRHRVGDVVVGHGQDRDLGHRTPGPLHHAGPLIQAGQVGVEIAGIALTAGDLALGGGELTQRLAVGGDVGHDDQDVHILLKGQVFRSGQCALRGEDTLDNRVVGQV